MCATCLGMCYMCGCGVYEVKVCVMSGEWFCVRG